MLQLPDDSNNEISDDSAKPFPLSHLLLLYEKGSYVDLYCNYMEGFCLLVKWLSPISQSHHYDAIEIPKLLGNYELQEVSKILGIDQCQVLQTLIFESSNLAIQAGLRYIRAQENTNYTN